VFIHMSHLTQLEQQGYDWTGSQSSEIEVLAMLTDFTTDLGHMALATWDGEIVGLAFGHSRAEQTIRSLKSFYTQSDRALLDQATRESSSEAAFFNERVARLLKKYATGESV